MGVFSHCVSSTATVPASNIKPALASLKKGIMELGFMDDLNIEFCTSLAEALTTLDFEFELDGEDLSAIQFSGGKGDNSTFVLPLLAPYIVDGGKIVMDVEDSREITTFNDGQMCLEVLDEDDYGDEDHGEDDYDEAREELESEFFSLAKNAKITQKSIDATTKEAGGINFLDVCDRTPLIALLERASEDYDKWSIEVAHAPGHVTEQVKLLLAEGPNLDQVSDEGLTALLAALGAGWFDLAKELIDAGAAIQPKTASSPYALAANASSIELIEFLKVHDPVFSAKLGETLVFSCGRRDYDNGNKAFIDHLVSNDACHFNAAIDARSYLETEEVQKGATPLMAAAQSGNNELVQWLLDNGADPDKLDHAGNNALHYCSGQTWSSGGEGSVWWPREENAKVVKLLADNADRIRQRNQSRQTPYSLAKTYNPDALGLFRESLSKAEVELPVELSDQLNGKVSFHGDGQLGYTLQFKDGQLHGTQRFTNKHGNLFVQVDYQEGQVHGDYLAFYDEGQPMFESSCANGNWHGEIRLMSDNGLVGQQLNYANGKRHGVQVVRDADGEDVIRAHYKDGRKHGQFYFRKPDGEVVIDEEYIDGEPAGSKAEEKKKQPKANGLAGLFSTLLGGFKPAHLAAELAEDKLKPTDKLFFHKQDKVFALFEKTQANRL